jgi:hypothetical protein
VKKIDKTEIRNIVTALVKQLKKEVGAERCMKLSIANYPVFESVEESFQNISGINWEKELRQSKKYDFILGDLPLGMKKRQEYEIGKEKLKIRQNWAEILKSIKFLDENGIALYLVEPTCFGNIEGEKFEKALNTAGYYVNAIFKAPEGILHPVTAITPVFVLITKKNTKSVFLVELLNETQTKEAVKNYYKGKIVNDLRRGMGVKQRTFKGFQNVTIKQQLGKLETQYKEYEEYTIGQIAKEINIVTHGKKHVEKENSVYIPKIGRTPVVAKTTKTTIKHHNYIQVVLGEKAKNEYVAAFFKSDIGKLVLQSLTIGTTIPHLNIRELEQATIAIPRKEDQKQIIETQRKLSDLKEAIDNFDSELALNPISSISIITQLDSMLEAIGGLTEVDEVHRTIRQGETKTIEFKESLSLDIKKQTKEKYIEVAALKTIVAFLNTHGGTLLVGVADDGTIKGIDKEIEKFYKGNIDKYLLHIKNIIKTRIGEGYYPYIEYKIININRKKVLVVMCKASKSPCFLDNAEFYVRTNPATDKLEGPKIVEYVKNHFGK